MNQIKTIVLFLGNGVIQQAQVRQTLKVGQCFQITKLTNSIIIENKSRKIGNKLMHMRIDMMDTIVAQVQVLQTYKSRKVAQHAQVIVGKVNRVVQILYSS